MSAHHDPELEDVLQDDELRRLAHLLSSAQRAEPPVDDAFRSSLRRQLMQQAEAMGERRVSVWRRAFAPPGLAWAGAAAGLLLIASVVVFMVNQPATGGLSQVIVSSAIDGNHGVQLQQPILVSFNTPMDHASTEAAVQITPATSVTYSWQDNTLAVLPASGNLAPNTQYQVTIGPNAQTVAGTKLAAPQTITFDTQPQTTPSPSPAARPSPTPGPLLSGEKQLATFVAGRDGGIQWATDSSVIYLVSASGALESVPARGGDVTVIAPDGASSPAMAPAGDRLAYIRGGKIQTLTVSTNTTDETSTTTPATRVGWAKDKLLWTSADGVYSQGSGGPVKLAPLPTDSAPTVLSIAPDGTHVAYQQDSKLFLLDVGTGNSVQLGQSGAGFEGWSPNGSQLMYSSPGGIVVSDLQGSATTALAGTQASWSVQDAILLGGDTSLSQVHPDGTDSIKLADGTYDSPDWAPDGTSFTFLRGGAIWIALAPSLPPLPSALDQATAVVNSFMRARLKGHADEASSMLDASGRQAYGSSGLSLIIGGDASFTRYYILTQEITATQPDTASFVVRLVLSRGKIDVSDFEETLTLVRDPSTHQFVIDQAQSGAHLDLGKGAEVVGVELTRSVLKVSFDSDLDPSTVARGVMVLDDKGNPLHVTASYRNRTVTLSGLDLRPGAQYKLVVATSVEDVLGQNVAAEYDLLLVGPVPASHESHQGGSGPSPSPLAATTSPTPAA